VALHLVHDADFIFIDLDPVDQEPKNLSFGFHVGLIQAVADMSGKRLEVAHN
jgi:hypothetical protein